MKNLKRQFSKYDKSIEKTKPQYAALLGKTSKVVEHPTRKGFCYARMADNLNELIVVFNDKVSQVWNLPVLVSRRGNTWYVVGRDTLRYGDWGSDSSFIPKHHSQHEFNRDGGTGGDAVFIYPDQFVPLLCYPSGTLGSGNVIVAPYMLQRTADFVYVGNTGSPSLLPYKPTNNQGIMGLVYLDKTTGNPGLLIASGTPFAGSITGSASLAPYLPYPASNQEPLYFVRLVSGTSSILWDNLYNARQFIGGSTSTGTSSSLPSFITGSIPFAGSNGILTEDNLGLRYDPTHDQLKMGKEFALFNASGEQIHIGIVATNPNEANGISLLSYGTGTSGSGAPVFNGYRTRGTLEVPTPIQKDDALMSYAGWGYGGDGWFSAARTRYVANSNWVSGSSYESRIDFDVIPSGSTTRRVGATLYGDSFNLTNTGTYNINGSPHGHHQRILSADKTLVNGECWILSAYLELTNYTLTLEGDSILEIL